jgi:nitrous oxidase accessory protein NosD
MAEASGHNNVARNNHIDVSGNDFLYSHGPCAQLVERNFIKGCSEGVYTEPSIRATWKIVVRNNEFMSCAIGVSSAAHVGSMVEGYLIEGNRFTNCPVMVSIVGDDRLIHYREIIVRQNWFRKSGRVPRSSRAIHILSTNKAVVTGNVVDSAGAAPIFVRATSSTLRDNRTSKGSLVNGTN